MQEKRAYKWVLDNIPSLKHLKDANVHNDYSSYDWFQNKSTGADRPLRIEYKNRAGARGTCPETHPGGAMLEVDKMHRMWYDHGEVFYCCACKDGKMYFWSITNLMNRGVLKGTSYIKKCPKTSQFGDRTYIDKKVLDLPWNEVYAVYDMHTGVREK